LLREARFPEAKTLDQMQWPALKGVSRPKILELASGDFMGRAEDIILAGPIGTGKNHPRHSTRCVRNFNSAKTLLILR
jgi:DNA replication protein DnaC